MIKKWILFFICAALSINATHSRSTQEREPICALLEMKKYLAHDYKKRLLQFREFIKMKEKIINLRDLHWPGEGQAQNKIDLFLKELKSWLILPTSYYSLKKIFSYQNRRLLRKYKRLLEEVESIDAQKLERREQEFEIMEIHLKHQIEDNRNICSP